MVAAVMQHEFDPIAFVEGTMTIKVASIPPEARYPIVQQAVAALLKELHDSYETNERHISFETLTKSLEFEYSPFRARHPQELCSRTLNPRQVPLESIGHAPGDRFWTLAQFGYVPKYYDPDRPEHTEVVTDYRIVLSKRTRKLYVVAAKWKPKRLNGMMVYHLYSGGVDLDGSKEALDAAFQSDHKIVYETLFSLSSIANELALKAKDQWERQRTLAEILSKQLGRLAYV